MGRLRSALAEGVRRAARAFGFEIVRAAGDPAVYTRNCPFTFPTYAPWFEPAFLARYEPIRGRTLVTENRCYTIEALGRNAIALDGAFAECGTYRGGTAYLLAAMLREAGRGDRPLHLFDTFAGFPDSAVFERDSLRPGEWNDTSVQEVAAFLAPFPNVRIHSGELPGTFAPVRDERFAFVHVEVDLYPSTRDCCAFFYERLVSGGVLVCDDYGFADFRLAAKAAVDEFFADKPEVPLALHTGQCLVIKR